MTDIAAFELTPGDLARAAGMDAGTIREYERLGLIECRRLGNGTRLFQRSAIVQVRVIRERRLANRGRRDAA